EESANDGRFVLPAVSRFHDTQDIHVNDLGATLRAHRATNRAKILRRVGAHSDPTVKHILERELNDYTDHGQTSPTENTLQAAKERKQEKPVAEKLAFRVKGNRRKPWEFWPAGSIQHQQLVSSKQKEPTGSVLEYHARSINPAGVWKRPSEKACNNPYLFRPWHRYLEEQGGDALQRLGNEITAFERYMTLSSAELKAMTKVVSQVKHVTSSILGKCSCDVIGSYSTGLALAYSDIDFAINVPDVEKEAVTYSKSLYGLKFRKIYRRVLLNLQRSFAKDVNFTADPQLVYARVPIVRVMHRITGQEIQVQVSTGTRQQQQYTLAYLAEYRTLRSLYFVIRSCLEMRRLSITFEGGLGSYAILMLIVNALKHASGRYDPHDVGSQLLHVLDFYTSSDLYQFGFSIEPPRTFRKGEIPARVEERLSRASDPVLRGIDSIAKANPRKPYLLCLQDPADPTNDLGSRAYAIKHIQQTFATARKSIVREMEAWDQRPNATAAKHDDIGLLDALIYGNYRLFDHDRQRIGRYGMWTSEGSGHSRRTFSATGSYNGRKISAHEMLQKIDKVDKRKAAGYITFGPISKE
ncbi:MAG: hypothetical protein LQ343_001361, partial [Gyalolechia ehrenbergii]